MTQTSPVRTYAEVLQQIKILQEEAEVLRRAEIANAVARVKEAVSNYGLTAEDIFGTGKSAKSRSRTAETKTVPVKYSDGAGNSWTGRGRSPAWFLEALAAGKKPEDMRVN